MNEDLLDRGLAETYAGWFRALADPSRVQILHLLASAGRPMPVGEIVRRVHIGQSTVSHHLAVLAESRFVLVERAGTARLYRINDACITCFPSAADVVMGRSPAIPEEVGNARRPAPG
jgi:DNA-binding transcriptional ArsR family regulator